MTERRWGVDVVVVGAGFAGLTAARALARDGLDVVVLEGRDRVGGRSCPGEIAGVPVDLGGTFVGPTQDAVLALAAELGIATAPIYHDGANLIRWRGRVRSYRGTIPRISPLSLLDVGRVRWQFERIARGIPLATPWTAEHADRLDALSLADWLNSVHASRAARDLLTIAGRVIWGCEPQQLSMLHAARYVAAAGGLDRLLGVENAAQQDRIVGGSHRIAQAMADELGDRVITGIVVRRIDWQDSGASVHTDRGPVAAKAVIVAVAPAHRADIEFTPPLPPDYRRLAEDWPQGRLSKVFAAYPTPFWRADGLSGEALSDTGAVSITFDVSPGPDGPGILLGFVHSRGFDALPADQRRRRALENFAALFGDAALQPLDYLDHRWGAEEFAPGGPTAAVPPGSWTGSGRWLREPVGPIHWAGTETADEWSGFLDGAVRSGQRAAVEVAAATTT